MIPGPLSGASGDDAAAAVDEIIRTKAWPAFLAGTKGFGTQRNGWSVAFAAGRFGNDILARDIVNYGGLWANVIEEAIYYVGQLGSDGKLLNGDNTYEIRFPAGRARLHGARVLVAHPVLRARLPCRPEPHRSL